MKLDSPFIYIWNKSTLIVAFCLMLLIANSIAVILVKHKTRNLNNTSHLLQADRTNLQIEWSKYLLELGTWTSDLRIDWVARNKLKMYVPEKTEMIIP